jgi:hypothetical protein
MRESYRASIHPLRSTIAPALTALLAIPLSASSASAQALEVPPLSPHARVEQRVGLTELSIDYSSPGVKGRKIWGDLVPYDKAWRAGANGATKLTASRDFSFGGKPVKAGTYSLFVIPTKAQWTVLLNSDPAVGADDRDAKKDVASFTVAPAALAAPRERLIYLFNDTQDDRTSLDLEWERVRIRMPIGVDTKAQMTAAIEKVTGEIWRPHLIAAGYYFNSGDHDRALSFAEKSIALGAHWRNEWLRAQILGKKGKKAEATAAANRALTLGKGDEGFERNTKADVTKALAGWK